MDYSSMPTEEEFERVCGTPLPIVSMHNVRLGDSLKKPTQENLEAGRAVHKMPKVDIQDDPSRKRLADEAAREPTRALGAQAAQTQFSFPNRPAPRTIGMLPEVYAWQREQFAAHLPDSIKVLLLRNINTSNELRFERLEEESSPYAKDYLQLNVIFRTSSGFSPDIPPQYTRIGTIMGLTEAVTQMRATAEKSYHQHGRRAIFGLDFEFFGSKGPYSQWTQEEITRFGMTPKNKSAKTFAFIMQISINFAVYVIELREVMWVWNGFSRMPKCLEDLLRDPRNMFLMVDPNNDRLALEALCGVHLDI